MYLFSSVSTSLFNISSTLSSLAAAIIGVSRSFLLTLAFIAESDVFIRLICIFSTSGGVSKGCTEGTSSVENGRHASGVAISKEVTCVCGLSFSLLIAVFPSSKLCNLFSLVSILVRRATIDEFESAIKGE